MKVTQTNIKLELTSHEAESIAFKIQRSLERSIDEHYARTFHDSYKRGYEGHAKPLLYEQEGDSIKMMNLLWSSAGNEDASCLEESLMSYFEKKYIEFNKSLTLEDSL